MSVGVALTLVSLKVVVWWVSRSVSLLASAADSGLDLIAALATFSPFATPRRRRIASIGSGTARPRPSPA